MDGTKWNTVQAPVPSDTQYNQLAGVVALGGRHTARSNTEIVHEYAQRLCEAYLYSHYSDQRRRNMNIRKSALAFIFIPLALLLAGPAVAHAATGDPEGATTQMPAFFNGQQFTVNMVELSGNSEPAIIANNPSHNTIYAQADLDHAQPFPPVINAIQGDGFNPLWQQVLIHFNPGVTPHQFTSEAEVQAAAAAGQITLEVTNEVYRCSVVGPGPK